MTENRHFFNTTQISGLLYIGVIGILLMILSSCGGDSPTEPPVIPVDTTGPVVTLTNPANSASIGDTVTLRISSIDSLDIDRVVFRVDNLTLPGSVDSIAPFEFQWVAINRTDGQAIQFSAQAFDTAGNSRNPSKVNVTYLWENKPAIVSPLADVVVGDTVTITTSVSANTFPLAYVEFLRGGVIEPGSRDSVAPYTYLWDASVTDTSSANQITIRAVDNNGNSSVSSPITLHHLWRMLLTDPDDSWPRDISTLSVRSTSTQLQFRVTTNGAWTNYLSLSSGLAFVLFIDTDQNPFTGRTGFEFFPFPINDIGAEYRLQLGAFGDSISVFDAVNVKWQAVRQLTGLNVIAPPNDSVFELRINLSEIGSPSAIDIVTANIFQTTSTISWDFAPDQGNGHVTYVIDGSFSPAPPSPVVETTLTKKTNGPLSMRRARPTPFE